VLKKNKRDKGKSK